MTLRRIMLHHLVPGGPNPTAGMNPLVLMSIAYQLRTSTEDIDPPIKVRTSGASAFYAISEGRHRWMGAWIAGRLDILCEVEEEIRYRDMLREGP